MTLAPLLNAVEAAFETAAADDAPPRPPADGTLAAYRHGRAADAFAVVGYLYGRGKSEVAAEAAAAYKRLTPGHPLHDAQWKSIEDVAAALLQDAEEARRALAADWVASAGKLPPAKWRLRVEQLLAIGAIAEAGAVAQARPENAKAEAAVVRARMLAARGHQREADLALAWAGARYPARAAQAAAAVPARLAAPRESWPEAAVSSDASTSLLARVNDLASRQQPAEALTAAARDTDAVAGNLGLAMVVARLLAFVHRNDAATLARLRRATATLPARHRASHLIRGFEMTEAEALACADEAADQGHHVALAGLAGLAAWALPHAAVAAAPRLRDLPKVDALLRLAAGAETGAAAVLRRAATEAGFVVQDPAADAATLIGRDRIRQAAFDAPDAMRDLLTRRAAAILEQTAGEAQGLMMISAHGVLQAAGSLAPAAAAASFGHNVLSLFGVSVEARRRDIVAEAARYQAPKGALAVVNLAELSPSEQTERLRAHIAGGGALDIGMDGVKGERPPVVIPWVLQPHQAPTFAADTAIRHGAAVAYKTVFARPHGRMIVDLAPVPMVPDQGDPAVRAAWLTQRIARVARRTHLETKAPIGVGRLAGYGGRPRRRADAPVAAWGAATSGPLAWIAGPARDGAALALADRTLAFGDLQALALRFAALVQHFQAHAPAATATFADLHRVLMIAPEAEAMAVAALGAPAAGSLLALAKDSLDGATLSARVAAFRPDVVIATASAWTRVLAADPTQAATPALIIDDAGDVAAAEDLLESFGPATALCPTDPSRPAWAIQVTENDGTARTIVLPQGLPTTDIAGPSGDAVAGWTGPGLIRLLSGLSQGETIAHGGEASAEPAPAGALGDFDTLLGANPRLGASGV